MRVISQDANLGPQIWSPNQNQVSGLFRASQPENGEQVQGRDTNTSGRGLADADGTL